MIDQGLVAKSGACKPNRRVVLVTGQKLKGNW
jgi:hypothetical protein